MADKIGPSNQTFLWEQINDKETSTKMTNGIDLKLFGYI